MLPYFLLPRGSGALARQRRRPGMVVARRLDVARRPRGELEPAARLRLRALAPRGLIRAVALAVAEVRSVLPFAEDARGAAVGVVRLHAKAVHAQRTLVRGDRVAARLRLRALAPRGFFRAVALAVAKVRFVLPFAEDARGAAVGVVRLHAKAV